MAALRIEGEDLVVALTGLERIAAFHGDLRVPRALVRTMRVEPDPWCALRGIRAPGTGLPGVIAYGVRRSTGDRPDFAAVHGRGPAIRIELDPSARYARLLVTVLDPEATIAAVARAAGD
ncbi:MAG: hypothetical protein M3Y09_21190 [Actinomycetota bacterium]|nr:hypothetical protein [Actinomycetota bacterium]